MCSALRARIIAGRSALQAGQVDEARELFESVLAEEPHNRDANGGLAALALVNGGLGFLHGACIGLDGAISARLFNPD